jgi:KDO2-lipid IV(A) lauroyltransferase
MTINKSCLEKRFKIKNIEIPNSYFINGQSVIILASHYGNWEYGILATNMAIMHQAISLYLPLKNKHSEKYGLKRRSRLECK